MKLRKFRAEVGGGRTHPPIPRSLQLSQLVENYCDGVLYSTYMEEVSILCYPGSHGIDHPSSGHTHPSPSGHTNTMDIPTPFKLVHSTYIPTPMVHVTISKLPQDPGSLAFLSHFPTDMLRIF